MEKETAEFVLVLAGCLAILFFIYTIYRIGQRHKFWESMQDEYNKRKYE